MQIDRLFPIILLTCVLYVLNSLQIYIIYNSITANSIYCSILKSTLHIRCVVLPKITWTYTLQEINVLLLNSETWRDVFIYPELLHLLHCSGFHLIFFMLMQLRVWLKQTYLQISMLEGSHCTLGVQVTNCMTNT